MSKLTHGGRLRQAAIDYQIPLSDWLDLSTGVSPWTYPFNDVEQSAWNRLPEENDGLEEAARHYYRTDSLLAVAGSQMAIQLLPVIWERVKKANSDRRLEGCSVTHLTDTSDSQDKPNSRTVALPYQGYKEHEKAWCKAGWKVVHYHGIPKDDLVKEVEALVVINPNNPMGKFIEPKALLAWHRILRSNNALLVVDEAFCDLEPSKSLSHACPLPNLVVLRSIGKFFGLAGIRTGFVLACEDLLSFLDAEIGPWVVSGPARDVTKQALLDKNWQKFQYTRLVKSSARLKCLLEKYFLEASGKLAGTYLFQTVYIDSSELLHQALCQHGVLVRLTDEADGLRFGLPMNEAQWQRLTRALDNEHSNDLN